MRRSMFLMLLCIIVSTYAAVLDPGEWSFSASSDSYTSAAHSAPTSLYRVSSTSQRCESQS